MTASERRVVVVTGGATGIGRACGLRFARAGFDVVVNYSRSGSEAAQTVAEIEALGARGVAVAADVGDDSQVRALFGRVEREFGRLDVLVNNA
ncbi:MAG: SDR family NAD(P)-dependent oxidoreductase, partial [Planctomycetaceae bacterium]